MMLPRPFRLTKAQEFSRIYKIGHQVSSPHLRLFSLGTDQNFSRFGFVVSKKQIRKIVSRNRCKRILREQIRFHQPYLVSRISAIVQVKAGAANLAAKELREELTLLLKKAKLLKQ